MNIKKIFYTALLLIVILIIFDRCTNKTTTKIETKTVTKIVTDTIVRTEIIEVEKKVFINKVKTIKGKDSIIFVDKSSPNSIETNQYKVKLESNDAFADLTITSETKPFQVSGVITYPEKETITTITKTKDRSGLFLYGTTSLDFGAEIEVGLMYHLKNKVGIMSGINYNTITKRPDVKVGILIKL